ncbi:ABC transporter permease [Streptococcus lutetiensis]|uniref:ABC transporter permease n=1 Tax=Streptococcus lutetiensis TaxID=150055 RepID=UPI000DA32A57|nr:ABC transporter permease [Streptococcus lutetiensis]MBT0890613.1 ABC transporter permease [Streptococcus lutetiensis]MBT0902654.1 ABC transporter permease [Streptococcus lutetiensis]MBT0922330.1 ABC transporter permease [Streptococcus lutetiensis]QQT07173.1 ABC transporter permease [Streptococcus lutetiensis]SQG56348.1 ABC transporter permease [Streptococcus lutetiensis]
MFLAWNEMKHSKLRYGLVVGVIFLIAYLVFFLTGLANGLAQTNRSAVDSWKSDYVILNEQANKNLRMSRFSVDLKNDVNADKMAELTQASTTIKDKEKNKINVNLFAIKQDEFLRPKLSEGKLFSKTGEVVADSSLKKSYQLKIGDKITLGDSTKKLTITGFTDNASFNVQPVLYMTKETLASVLADNAQVNTISALVIRGKVNQVPKELESMTTSTFIENLPGYKAQNLTFSFMIGFLIVIAAIVIGIFIYILTLQKKAIFGVLKAQGISNGYLSQMVFAQTFILAILAVSLGLALTLLSAVFLPTSVPFQVNPLFFAGISVLMVLIAVFGALFSVVSIVKVDPLKAIG